MRTWGVRLLLGVGLLQLADILTTAVALGQGAKEVSPGGAFLMANFGQASTYVIKILGMGLSMYLIYRYLDRPWAKVLLGLALAISVLAVTNNIFWLLGWNA